MSKHLTENQLSMCILGKSTPDERQHLQECRQCKEELARFHQPISAFESAMKDWSLRQDVPRIDATVLARTASLRGWGWAAAGIAVVLAASIPIYKTGTEARRSSMADDAAILMEAVDFHLSRTVPAPMEPIMALIPINEYLSETEELHEAE